MPSDVSHWLPAALVWSEFAKANPALGLTGTDWSFTHFWRTHGDKLTAAGVAIKAKNRRIIADPVAFPPVATAIVLTGDLPPKGQA